LGGETHAGVGLGETDHGFELAGRGCYALFCCARVVAYVAEFEVGLDELVGGFFRYLGVDARAAVVDVCGQLVYWLWGLVWFLFFQLGVGGMSMLSGMGTLTRTSSPPVSGLSSM